MSLSWKDAWYNQFKGVLAFYQQHCHLNIPNDYDNGSGKALATWLVRQRALKAKGTLTAEQIALLESVGMIWVLEDPWEVGFKHAEEYYIANGNLNVNKKHICSDRYALGSWIGNQRSDTKTAHRMLSDNQVKRLESIGMIWNTHEFRWNEAYKIAEAFYQENGHLSVPFGYLANNDFDLYEWLYEQKRKHRSGKLSQEKIERLEKIGMRW